MVTIEKSAKNYVVLKKETPEETSLQAIFNSSKVELSYELPPYFKVFFRVFAPIFYSMGLF